MASRDVTPEVFCESDRGRIARITGQSRAWVEGMLIDRRGDDPDSNMTAIGLHAVVRNGEAYRVSARRGLSVAPDGDDALDLEAVVDAKRHDQAPDHATVTASWDRQSVAREDTQSALGDSVIFEVASDATEIEIPVLEANSELMTYYGAVLVEEGALVRFPNPEYPIWKMGLGKTYVDGMVMSDRGTGFYLEYHHDRPHWHQPVTADSGGYYILARQKDRDRGRSRYALTGFHIPHGRAVYTGFGAIHCDAALTGKNWLVGYTDSGDFSTALIRNRGGEPVKLSGADG